MILRDIIAKREISELLHFTTNRGITGMLASQALLPRKRLAIEKHLEHVYIYNCANRPRDAAWHDYVNLSITSVNRKLFGVSEGNWHADMEGWWCIVALSPEIMEHPGVYFTTTNNMYSGVLRAQGPKGLEALFASQITLWNANITTRSATAPANQPTCPQAEVLYPGSLPFEFVSRIYVKGATEASEIESILEVFEADTEIIIRADLFT